MNKSLIFVSYDDIEHPDWQPWTSCHYIDELAIFRCLIREGNLADTLLYKVLTPDERSRADRYRRKEDQLRFIVGRMCLRLLAATYLHRSPADILLVEGRNGKPGIKDAGNLQVNVSHAGDWVLVVVGKSSVGIDIEKVNPDFLFGDLLDQSFAPAEQQFIRQSSDPRRTFYQLWTRKEAIVKATAKGMDDDFALIPSLDGTHEVASLLIGEVGTWQVDSVDVANGYVASVARELPCGMPKFYTLESGFFEQFKSKE